MRPFRTRCMAVDTTYILQGYRDTSWKIAYQGLMTLEYTCRGSTGANPPTNLTMPDETCFNNRIQKLFPCRRPSTSLLLMTLAPNIRLQGKHLRSRRHSIVKMLPITQVLLGGLPRVLGITQPEPYQMAPNTKQGQPTSILPSPRMHQKFTQR